MRTLAIALAALLAGCSAPAALPAPAPAPVDLARDDVVVVAVIDDRFDPYHFDFLASQMPQHLDADATNDLPLGEDPSTWIPGYPAGSFASLTAMPLTLPTSGDEKPDALHEADEETWDATERSTPEEVHMRWIPGTKAVGFVNFASNDGYSATSHGVGTTSVSVGNLHGTCPQCVFVFVNGFSDEAVTWVSSQDWIDVQTNSWGYSRLATEKMWRDCDLDTQRAGVERGQQIFFSGGNGMANTPDGDGYSGAGKPADLANVGSSYPSAGGDSVKADDTFGGTSNATPVTAGLYAEALRQVRAEMPGPSRVQRDGAVAQGSAACGQENPACAAADGVVTVHEMREALFLAANVLESGTATFDSRTANPASTPEWRLMGQGHGSLFGRMGDHAAEAKAIADLVMGRLAAQESPEEVAFAVAVSWCSQQVWGAWEHGAWNANVTLPPADPQWPYRTWLVTECPDTIRAAMDAVYTIPEVPIL